MKRSQNIKDKLAYCLIKYQQLSNEIKAAQEGDEDVPYIAQKVGDILSGCRECFDYCAKDIADRFIATSQNQKLALRYKAGKEKAYFPFFESQLNSGSLFSELLTTAPQLHQELLLIAAEIKAKTLIPGTDVSYELVLETNQLVNDKKHDQITSTRIQQSAATHIIFPNGGSMLVSPLFPFIGDRPDFGADVGAQPMVGTEGVEIKYVREFKLVANNWEVGRFCMHAILATTRVLTKIYSAHFGVLAEHFDPWETIKPEHIKKAETLLKTLSPMQVRPLRVVLSLNATEQLNCEISFDGVPNSREHADISMSNLFSHIFEACYLQTYHDELKRSLFSKEINIDASDLSPRHSEFTISFSTLKSVLLSNGKKYSFNQILFGIGTKFCCGDIFRPQEIDASGSQAIFQLIQGNAPSLLLDTDETGKIMSCSLA